MGKYEEGERGGEALPPREGGYLRIYPLPGGVLQYRGRNRCGRETPVICYPVLTPLTPGEGGVPPPRGEGSGESYSVSGDTLDAITIMISIDINKQ